MKSKFLHEKRKELLDSKKGTDPKRQPDEKSFRLSDFSKETRKDYDDVYSDAELKKIDRELVDLLMAFRRLTESVSRFSDNSKRKRLKTVSPEFDMSKFLAFISFSESVLKKERNKINVLISDRDRILSVYASAFSKV